MKTLFSLGCALFFLASLHAASTPDAPITLKDFRLVGDLHGERAAFMLTATAHVENPGSLDLLSGTVALTEIGPHPKWQVRVEQNRFALCFEHKGDYPIKLKFTAAVKVSDGWNTVDFRVAPSALQPIVLQGLAADTQFQFVGAARPERAGNDFTSFLPDDGSVKLSWKEARREAEGKLFYAAEALTQIIVRPGLMRQTTLLDFKVMQGELNQVTLALQGVGEVTRVQGDQVLSWNFESADRAHGRRLTVRLNQPQKEHFALQIQMQTPLGAFPQTADAMQLRPEGATRYAGWIRVVNEGAVRLEVAQASGLSQISPEQFPETDATKSLFPVTGSQRFAYRFSGGDFALRIQADQIFPELSVSQVTAYNLGENELAIDSEIELDVREAPLRELALRVPKGYAVARLTATGLSDYFLTEPAERTDAELRLVFAQPLSGRQLIQLRLERNQALGAADWTLPRIEVAKAKSVRGHIAVSADAGYRLTAARTQSLVEIATAFFPRKIAGIQTAFRLNDAPWEATLHVERLPQTVQADVLHLFSIGEGIAYGSSVINYTVSGAPVSAFRVELSDEYANIEFTGKDVRNWQKTNGGFIVQLHSPVAGSYTLLATYERPFKSQGETLAFTGARPVDAQSEQGHTLVVSAYQFQVKPVEVSPGLLALETGEVPSEYRLFFDAPILAAYRYTARPFNLRLTLTPRVQHESLSQVVDRATLTTRISKEGQVLTDARYFVKNRGNPNFRFTLPEGSTNLWSATVNGAPVVPVLDGKANLIPLPQRADPNAVLTVELKLAARSKDPGRVTVAAPILAAPILLAEWQLEPDPGQRLIYRKGSLVPVDGVPDNSGFAGLARAFTGVESGHAIGLLIVAILLVVIAIGLWRWTLRNCVERFSAKHVLGTGFGMLAFALGVLALFNLGGLASLENRIAPLNATFLAPVQQAGSSLSITVANVPVKTTAFETVAPAWPVVLALLVWLCGKAANGAMTKAVCGIVGWTFFAWAMLRLPHGATAFCFVLIAFLIVRVAMPALRRLWQLPRRENLGPAEAPAVAAWILGGLIWLSFGQPAEASRVVNIVPIKEAPLAESVTQQIRVEDKFAIATAKIHWQAEKGQTLPVLFEPAVMTRIIYPTRALKLAQAQVGGKRAQELVAKESGAFDIEVQYEVQISKLAEGSGFNLPTRNGLVNQVNLTLANLDVDVSSPQAVSIQRDAAGSNTVAKLVLSPLAEPWIGWHPRRRDVKREKPVFYAELNQLYVPSAGVIEGAHHVALRPAQGELSELTFEVPKGATITDVTEPVSGARTSAVSLWRFDPDTRKLRVSLNPPQSRPFALIVRSQVATGPLPLEQTIGLLSVDNAAEQIGLLGIATGSEVQLDNVTANGFSPINLEDFPGGVAQLLQAQFPGFTVHRAFRYADAKAVASIKASAVEPDVRVESQETLSLGEDRTVLAASLTVDITRAGIFRLSFLLPAGMDVESVSGGALSHWTEAKSDVGRIITLHLRGKTEGQQQFDLSLSGPGVKATNGWTAPELALREASKQRGTLLIVPEQGMRLQIAKRDGLTQLDPQKSGIRQKGVLAFRVLQAPWNLALDIEQVEPWVQVTSLQHALINEAQVKVIANLQYQIENTGLKAFRVLLPTNAANVHFQGAQVADFLPVAGTVTNGSQLWEVKLQRRVIGQFMLQASYQTLLPEHAAETTLRGVQAADVNLQRGFLTVQAGGRLQLRPPETAPATLQPAEWQSIPRVLQQDLTTASANFAYRLVDPAFQLELKLDHREAAKLLPARINNITFTSVISDAGVMLTHARLEMQPGDERLLSVALPENKGFWFAFVNQNGVWPWAGAQTNSLLIPLEPPARVGQSIPVEFFYTTEVGRGAGDLRLPAPKFELPLENITWRVFLDEKWRVKHWSGSFQLEEQQVIPCATTVDARGYLEKEAVAQRQKTKAAEEMLAMGNSLLQNGDPQQARRAFQSAYGLSQGDDAFNEDSRVQLNNLKVQQALVGLNLRQAAAGGDAATLNNKWRELRDRRQMAYTQQDAKDIIERNSADENTAFMRLAERLIQQQDAAVSSPAAIRANVPEQGRLLTFKRAVAVDPMADLKIDLETAAVKAASKGVRFMVLAGTLLLCAALAWAAGTFRRGM